MAFLKYTNSNPPFWLNHYVDDDRISAGEYTYFDSKIVFGLWQPEDRIQIGRFCSLARDITIFGGGEHLTSRATTFPFVLLFAEDRPKRIVDGKNKGATVIGNDVWIGCGATIMSGVTIGHGAVIGAKAVVAKDIPEYAIAVGNPAKITRYRFNARTRERLLALSWWNWDLAKILANVDILYQNPETWTENIQFREPVDSSIKALSPEQLRNWNLL